VFSNREESILYAIIRITSKVTCYFTIFDITIKSIDPLKDPYYARASPLPDLYDSDQIAEREIQREDEHKDDP